MSTRQTKLLRRREKSTCLRRGHRVLWAHVPVCTMVPGARAHDTVEGSASTLHIRLYRFQHMTALQENVRLATDLIMKLEHHDSVRLICVDSVPPSRAPDLSELYGGATPVEQYTALALAHRCLPISLPGKRIRTRNHDPGRHLGSSSVDVRDVEATGLLKPSLQLGGLCNAPLTLRGLATA